MCATLPSAETSLCCGEAGKKEKESARGTMGRGKGKRGLCHIMCGSLAGFAVLWFWLNRPTIWALLRTVLKMTPFPSSHRPLRAFHFFSIIAIFIGISSGSLGGGESGRAALKACWLTLFFILRIPKILRVLVQDVPYGSIIK